MDPYSVFFEILFFLLFPSSVHSANNNEPDWTRNLDQQVTRLNSRLDQLMVRMDHLDSRVGRIQSLVQMRFDNIENGLTTTKLRMDLWGDDLNRIEEQLTRKWKTFETKFDALVGGVDAKLESKLNSIQRDNRRHSEFLTQSFSNVVQGQDQISLSLQQVNSTVATMKKSLQKSNHSEEMQKTTNNTNYLLLSNKVTNMFDDLLKKSMSIEGSMKDSIAISNATRRDLHEGFRSVISASNQHNLRNPRFPVSGASSSETMSAVIVEALASVETLSTALGRRLAELSRSIEERFEIVSMALNGFLDSCLRIQDGEAIVEERIAHILDRVLDKLDNSTRTATQIWLNVTTQLLQEKASVGELRMNCTGDSSGDETLTRDYEEGGGEGGGGGGGDVNVENYARELLRASGDLTEEDKKSLWDSLFPVPE